MILSLRWVFDHIQAALPVADIQKLIARCTVTTAEVEGWRHITYDMNSFTLAQVTSINQGKVVAHSPEWQETMTLPTYDLIQNNHWYLIKKDGTKIRWARSGDLHAPRDYSLPALHVQTSEQAGGWKKNIPHDDWLIEIDNKSITHRPDLWSHRGFAREFALMVGAQLKPLAQCITEHSVQEHAIDTQAKTNDLAITVQDKEYVKRFAAMPIENIPNKPSLLPITFDLLKVDGKPISMIVDMVNYVLYDCGQPMHAFDAAKLARKQLTVGRTSMQKLALLDGTTATLGNQDVVVSDGSTPLALAGIMGGAASSVSSATTDLIVESACFDATLVRKEAERHKIRTESSVRFEKALDPHQNIIGLLRLLYVLDHHGITYHAPSAIVSLGKVVQQTELAITHAMIEQRLGVTLEPGFVVKTLEALGYQVQHTQQHGTYTINIPTFRSTKEPAIAEDIIEEVGRWFGYDHITPTLPLAHASPKNNHSTHRIRHIRNTMALKLRMHEVYNYALFDEPFLQQLQWSPQPGETLDVVNPISEHWRRLVTSLIPGLLKNCVTNQAGHSLLRFFEWGKVWHTGGDTFTEHEQLAGVIGSKEKGQQSFYYGKQLLQELYDSLGLAIQWQPVEKPKQPWFMPYQTAHIIHDNTIIGTAGMLHPLFGQHLFEHHLFLFELDGTFLMHYNRPTTAFVPLPRYPAVERDISMFVPVACTVETLQHAISAVDSSIVQVLLVDYLQKEEWKTERAVTLRVIVQHPQKTCTKQEVEDLYKLIVQKIEPLGVVIR